MAGGAAGAPSAEGEVASPSASEAASCSGEASPASRSRAAAVGDAIDGGAPRDLGRLALFLSAFLIATCGLIYELVAGAMASYLLGDSITQFSLVIGCYLSAMGLGSYLSRHLRGDLLVRFIQVEVAVGVLGGFSSVALLGSYALLGTVRPLLFTLVGAIGCLVGLEIPVLMRILKDDVNFTDLVARVLAFDYLGALAASLLFPLLFVPVLGLPRTAFAFGLLNAGVAVALTWVFREHLGGRAAWVRGQALLATAFLVVGFGLADEAAGLAERAIYDAPVLFKTKTPYQTIVVTRWREDVRLMLDGHLQFSSVDEHRYHEALVHPAVAALRTPLRRALVIGGGDGMALRELLRYPDVQALTLVDLDPEMTRLFTDDELLSSLNGHAYSDPRVTVVNRDGLVWLEETDGVYDLVIVDLPDPRNYSLAKLYSRGFYRLVRRHLAAQGALAVQATTPFGPPRRDGARGSYAFWCIERTLADAGFSTRPYHCHVPSFGEWGFVLATPQPRPTPSRLAPGLQGLRFLNDATLAGLFAFPRDLAAPDDVEVNRLDDLILVRYHDAEWGRAGG